MSANMVWIPMVGTAAWYCTVRLGTCWAGYNGAAEIQTASALTGIKIVYVYLPVILNILSAVILSFYKLEKEYSTIVKELEERKAVGK